MEYRYQGLIEPLKQLAGMDDLLNSLSQKENVKVINMVDACKAHFAYALSCFSGKNMVIITYDELSTKKVQEDMQALRGEEKVLVYPSRDILFYNADVHSMDITSARLRVINALVKGEDVTIIIPVEALLDPLSCKETWQSYVTTFKVGDTLHIESLIKQLVQMGYERTPRVEGMGQFAIRGGIVDIFGPISEVPYRMELWDDEIDSIRSFNVETQRSISKVEAIEVQPVQEILFPQETVRKAVPAIREELRQTVSKLRQEGRTKSAEKLREQIGEAIEKIEEEISPRGLELYVPFTDLKTVSILTYLQEETLLVMDEPLKMKERCGRVLQEYQASMEDRLNYGHILPSQIDFIFDYGRLLGYMMPYSKVMLMNFESHLEDFEIGAVCALRVHENTTFYKNIDLLEKDLKALKQAKKKVVILCGVKAKALRLMEELEQRGIIATYTEKMEETVHEGQVLIYKGYLEKGFSYEEIGLCLIADKDLFGKEKKERKRKKKYQGTKIQSFLELSPGDYVVHEQYGIGVFRGIEEIKVEGISKDNLKIEYADKNVLYVSINQMDLVQKYVGAEGKEPKLNKIGSADWHRSKAKVKGAIKNIARDLIQLYSQRQYERGFKYEPDTTWQREFEEMFPYEETGDQLDAIEDVKQDMESDKIMDRLICGDVGYGKTEVAIRAAFKAVQSGKQVAYLVPTTILAQQHYKRFKERMATYPIEIELLSRFRTQKQIKEALKKLGAGQADIVIGTHRLLSSDVKFKDLGLVIIDEEQRFGVTHKEKLKQMRTQVDVMNLTATPIPRTLHMSLIGVRDMSVLEEAPVERKAVQTYVIEYSEDFIKDAINRELARGGQVYFLHNQVRNIEEMAMSVQDLVPEARVAFAHGQMSERELEKIMVTFIQGEIDVLVSTTIIETGLDIANANTIIINDADRMGLSQLYQLRGRVGRSSRMGYAYLMYQKNKVLKEVAEKRLQAIKQFTELGAGFKIAMRDLEIRGAGNLLGAQQHGHMEAIGYDLYCKMLTEAVSEERGEEKPQDFETTVEIKISAYIPPTYITDEVQKLDIYKKIASITQQSDYLDIQEEIEDRYGTIPEPAANLLEVALIKSMAHDLYITLVSESQNEVIFKFKEDAPLEAEALPEIMKEYGKAMKITAGKAPVIKVQLETSNRKKILSNIKSILHALNKLKSPQE